MADGHSSQNGEENAEPPDNNNLQPVNDDRNNDKDKNYLDAAKSERLANVSDSSIDDHNGLIRIYQLKTTPPPQLQFFLEKKFSSLYGYFVTKLKKNSRFFPGLTLMFKNQKDFEDAKEINLVVNKKPVKYSAVEDNKSGVFIPRVIKKIFINSLPPQMTNALVIKKILAPYANIYEDKITVIKSSSGIVTGGVVILAEKFIKLPNRFKEVPYFDKDGNDLGYTVPIEIRFSGFDSSLSSEDKPEKTCFYCKSKDHMVNSCPKKLAKRQVICKICKGLECEIGVCKNVQNLESGNFTVVSKANRVKKFHDKVSKTVFNNQLFNERSTPMINEYPFVSDRNRLSSRQKRKDSCSKSNISEGTKFLKGSGIAGKSLNSVMKTNLPLSNRFAGFNNEIATMSSSNVLNSTMNFEATFKPPIPLTLNEDMKDSNESNDLNSTIKDIDNEITRLTERSFSMKDKDPPCFLNQLSNQVNSIKTKGKTSSVLKSTLK